MVVDIHTRFKYTVEGFHFQNKDPSFPLLDNYNIARYKMCSWIKYYLSGVEKLFLTNI